MIYNFSFPSLDSLREMEYNSVRDAVLASHTQEGHDVNPITGEAFVVGNEVTFKYHDKLRVGKVDRVGPTYVILEHDEECPKHKTKFKSYSFSKIQPV